MLDKGYQPHFKRPEGVFFCLLCSSTCCAMEATAAVYFREVGTLISSLTPPVGGPQAVVYTLVLYHGKVGHQGHYLTRIVLSTVCCQV